MVMLIVKVLFGAVPEGIWPMWGGDVEHGSVQYMKGAMVDAPTLKWGFADVGLVEWEFSAVEDLDGDGLNEVIVGNWSTTTLYCLNGSDGTEKWSFATGSWTSSSPAIADVDEDGDKEVVFGCNDYNVYCLDGATGTQEWSFNTGTAVKTNSPTAADIDGDGHLEIVIGSGEHLYCLNGSDGTQKWVFTPGDTVESCPAVADLDGDGHMEVVVGSFDHNIYCLDGATGTEEWSYSTYGQVRSSPAAADLDGDGHMEVVVGSQDHYVYCLNGTDGTQKWVFPTMHYVNSSPAIGDVDGDGRMEVIMGSLDCNVYCINGSDGTERWRYGTPSYVQTPGSLVDIDGDNKLEFLVPQYGDTLYCLNAEDGSLAWKIALAGDIHTPFTGDIDGDGCVEIIAGTAEMDVNGYKLFVLDDSQDASDCGTLAGAVGEAGSGASLEFRNAGNGLYVFSPRQTQISLMLFDASGRLVQSLYNGVISAGAHSFIPKTQNPGVYFAVLRYSGNTMTLKISR